MREWWARLRSALRFWWRTHRKVDPFVPGHSALERMRALDQELRWVEDASEAELTVRVRVEQ